MIFFSLRLLLLLQQAGAAREGSGAQMKLPVQGFTIGGPRAQLHVIHIRAFTKIRDPEYTPPNSPVNKDPNKVTLTSETPMLGL